MNSLQAGASAGTRPMFAYFGRLKKAHHEFWPWCARRFSLCNQDNLNAIFQCNFSGAGHSRQRHGRDRLFAHRSCDIFPARRICLPYPYPQNWSNQQFCYGRNSPAECYQSDMFRADRTCRHYPCLHIWGNQRLSRSNFRNFEYSQRESGMKRLGCCLDPHSEPRVPLSG